LLARRDVPDTSLEESSPDHLGASLDTADASDTPTASVAIKPTPIATEVVRASLTARDADPPLPGASMTASSPVASVSAVQSENSPPEKLPTSGTVVVDVEEGGIEVPSFLGKNLRLALEAAQEAGLDLDAIGSGVAREQSPQPGAHVAAGARITVRFGR
jgi:hypothetical protein